MDLINKIDTFLNEGKTRKPAFGTDSDGFNFAVQIDTLEDNNFPIQAFGRRLNDERKARAWTETATKGYVGAKGKATLPAVKKWVKENKPKEFYARWKKDSSSWKDDVVEIWYKN